MLTVNGLPVCHRDVGCRRPVAANRHENAFACTEIAPIAGRKLQREWL